MQKNGMEYLKKLSFLSGKNQSLAINLKIVTISAIYAPVAQLDRVGGFEPLGRGFESLRVRHFLLTFPA